MGETLDLVKMVFDIASGPGDTPFRDVEFWPECDLNHGEDPNTVTPFIGTRTPDWEAAKQEGVRHQQQWGSEHECGIAAEGHVVRSE